MRVYDVRHLHVSLLVKQGFDPRAVANRVDHTGPSFTMRRYSHMFDEQRAAMTILIADLFKALPRVQPEALN